MSEINFILALSYIFLVKKTDPEDLVEIHRRVMEETELPPRGPLGSEANIKRVNLFTAKAVELLSELHEKGG